MANIMAAIGLTLVGAVALGIGLKSVLIPTGIVLILVGIAVFATRNNYDPI